MRDCTKGHAWYSKVTNTFKNCVAKSAIWAKIPYKDRQIVKTIN